VSRSLTATASHTASSSGVHVVPRLRAPLRLSQGKAACSAGLYSMYRHATALARARARWIMRCTFLTVLGASPDVLATGMRPARYRATALRAAWIVMPSTYAVRSFGVRSRPAVRCASTGRGQPRDPNWTPTDVGRDDAGWVPWPTVYASVVSIHCAHDAARACCGRPVRRANT